MTKQDQQLQSTLTIFFSSEELDQNTSVGFSDGSVNHRPAKFIKKRKQTKLIVYKKMHSIGSLQPALLYNLDVSVSPEEDAVWLTKEEIGLLFERKRSVIPRHISNIFEEGELLK